MTRASIGRANRRRAESGKTAAPPQATSENEPAAVTTNATDRLTGPQIVALLNPLDGPDLIAAVRLRAGMNLTALARVSGMHPDTLAKIAAGKETTRAQRAALAWTLAYAQDEPKNAGAYEKPLWSERRKAARAADA